MDGQMIINNYVILQVSRYAPFASPDFEATSLRILNPEFFVEHRNVPRIPQIDKKDWDQEINRETPSN